MAHLTFRVVRAVCFFLVFSLMALVSPGGSFSVGAAGAAPQEKAKAAPTVPALIEALARGAVQVVDLTHALSEKFPAWPGDSKVFVSENNATVEKNGYFTRSFWTLEHFGTHLDAPAHFPGGKITVDQIPVKNLIGSAVVIDIVEQGREDSDYRITAADILAWEKRNGRIPHGAIVLARTGWAERVADAERYRNQDADGVMHFPGFSVEAAKLLIERKVNGLGIDTLSVDYGASQEFEVHQVSHRAGLYHLENLAGLSELPERGALLIVAPIKLAGGSGGPVRVFALVP